MFGSGISMGQPATPSASGASMTLSGGGSTGSSSLQFANNVLDHAYQDGKLDEKEQQTVLKMFDGLLAADRGAPGAQGSQSSPSASSGARGGHCPAGEGASKPEHHGGRGGESPSRSGGPSDALSFANHVADAAAKDGRMSASEKKTLGTMFDKLQSEGQRGDAAKFMSHLKHDMMADGQLNRGEKSLLKGMQDKLTNAARDIGDKALKFANHVVDRAYQDGKTDSRDQSTFVQLFQGLLGARGDRAAPPARSDLS